MKDVSVLCFERIDVTGPPGQSAFAAGVSPTGGDFAVQRSERDDRQIRVGEPPISGVRAAAADGERGGEEQPRQPHASIIPSHRFFLRFVGNFGPLDPEARAQGLCPHLTGIGPNRKTENWFPRLDRERYPPGGSRFPSRPFPAFLAPGPGWAGLTQVRVRLSGLASSWAAFVVHASHFLSPGGRLGLVLPAELLSVSYASEVRNFLLRRFGIVRLVMFEELVFPGVLEDVVLLLAEGQGPAPHFEVYQARNAADLANLALDQWPRSHPWKALSESISISPSDSSITHSLSPTITQAKSRSVGLPRKGIEQSIVRSFRLHDRRAEEHLWLC